MNDNIFYMKVQAIGRKAGFDKSFGVIIPKKIAIDLGIGKGDYVIIHQEDKKIILEKVI
jgi:AbrB family looped-hinge helix DNA binding protein